MKKKKKRKLKLPFRIIRNLIMFVITIILIFFAVYKYFIEDDLNSMINAYNNTIYNEEYSNNINTNEESYTIAILGVDESLEYSRTDSISLMVVNPKTNESVIYSVPRDSYVQYECIDDYSDKITNAHSRGGIECTLDALENIFDVNIDFYVKLDFTGFITIIDQLGTIETEVPDFLDGKTWCEQTSDRSTQICFEEFGKQEVTAEQALALTRSRQYSSDLDRNNIQGQVIEDTITRFLEIRDMKTLENIFLSLEGQFETNIDLKQAAYMTYNMYELKKEEHVIEKVQLEGIADYYVGNYVGWGSYFMIDQEGLETIRSDIKEFMKKEGEVN